MMVRLHTSLTGQTDLMYASQIFGNRWDGSRFSNTDGTGTPLTYKHLLTQLTFKAMKKVTGGLSVKSQEDNRYDNKQCHAGSNQW